MRPAKSARTESGLTLLELVVTAAILGILAAAAIPMYEVGIKRNREIELRRSLRQLRRAIDEFNESYVASGGSTGFGATAPAPQSQGPTASAPASPNRPAIGTPPTGVPGGAPGAGQTVPLIDVSQFDPVDSRGYPPDLKTLADGVQAFGGGTDDLVKFLRRIPIDPMIDPTLINTSDDNFGWGVRAYQDRPDATVWGRQNVWDVFSTSQGTALDGTKYKDW